MRRIDALSPQVVARRIAVAVVLLSSVGCGRKHHLAQYQFSDRTLGLVYIDPPEPELLHAYLNLNVPRNAVQVVVAAGGEVAKEIQARRASARLDSAVRQVDVAGLLAQRTVARASRYLGTRASSTPESADYVLEVTMRSFGLDARSSGAAYLYTKAEAVLIDKRTGREIWSEEVHGRERLTPYVVGTRNIPGSIITAGTLSTVSVADFAEALDQLVTYTSNLITEELRDKLRDVRDR
jgi:ABC-type uncharacterized transport system auxiliary subunit